MQNVGFAVQEIGIEEWCCPQDAQAACKPAATSRNTVFSMAFLHHRLLLHQRPLLLLPAQHLRLFARPHPLEPDGMICARRERERRRGGEEEGDGGGWEGRATESGNTLLPPSNSTWPRSGTHCFARPLAPSPHPSLPPSLLPSLPPSLFPSPPSLYHMRKRAHTHVHTQTLRALEFQGTKRARCPTPA
jgi:hypothetical protein